MAEVFAPFIIHRTIGNLTFYCMEGRNFVRKKSSLTRKKVLYAPQFKNTRHFAGLMAKASTIGSLVFNALPAYWRQGWMYRSFTGEAFSLLKAGNTEQDIQQLLWERYVKDVVNRQPREVMVAQCNSQPKRAYRKVSSTYWTSKTSKHTRRQANRQRLMHNAGLMAQASKTGAKLYAQLPRKYTSRRHYQYLTGLAFQLLKWEISEEDILTALRPTLPSVHREHKTIRKKPASIVHHPKGQYHFILSLRKRFPAAVNGVFTARCFNLTPGPRFFNLILKRSIADGNLPRKKKREAKAAAANPRDDTGNGEFIFIAGYTSNGVHYGISREKTDGLDLPHKIRQRNGYYALAHWKTILAGIDDKALVCFNILTSRIKAFRD